MYIHICIYMYICIHILYIYIYTYICTYMCVRVYKGDATQLPSLSLGLRVR